MGVSLELFRCRIGLFNFRHVKVPSTSSTNHNVRKGIGLSLRHIPVATLCLLLIISGIEQNPGPTVFICKYCSLSFRSAAEYCDHIRIHKLWKNFTIPCTSCNRQVKSLTSLQSHMSRFHRNVRERPTIKSIKAVKCSECKIELDTRSKYKGHMEAHLTAGVSITCVLTNCSSKFVDKKKFVKHMSRCHRSEVTDFAAIEKTVSEASFPLVEDTEYDDDHPEAEDEEPEQETFYDCSSEATKDTSNIDGVSEDPYPEYVIKDEIARFYLKLEGQYSLATSIVQDIAQEIKLISELSHHRLKIALMKELQTANLEEQIISSIVKKTFKCDPIFNVHHKREDIEHFGTHLLRSKYWQQRFPYVEPKEHTFGVNAAGNKRRAHYVPIRETLNILTRDKAVKKMVKESFERPDSEPSILQDFTDGEAYRKHKCEHHDGKCLQLLLFQDAFEFNAFGPAATLYKPIGFYYTLGNMPPEYRSKVDLIQLAMLVLEKDTIPTQQEELDGLDILKEALKPLLDELVELKRNGIEIDGEKIPVCLLFLLGDNLGQNTVGGFVKTFTCEFVCRFCPMSKTQFLAHPDELLPFRTPEEYDEAVQIAKRKWEQKRRVALRTAQKRASRKAKERADRVLSRCTAPAKKTLIKELISKSAYKKLCAVSYRAVKYRPSPFNSPETNFHVSSPATAVCISHDLHEGLVKIVVARVLNYCINEKQWFDFATLNRRIKSFKCKGSDKRDAPKPLKNIDQLNGNAVQNWNFLRLLPFIIGDLIQDPKDEVWQTYLQLKEICEYVSAPKISLSQVAYLRHIIRSFINNLKRLPAVFTKCLIPKLHFLCHYPDLIALYGPLIRLFTLRYESRHVIFKRIMRMCKNYINVTKTLATKYMCHFAYDHASGLIPADIIYDPSTSSYINIKNLSEAKRAVFKGGFDAERTEALDSIVVKGIEYKKGLHLVLNSNMDSSSFEVGCIDLIFLDDSNNVSFLLEVKEAVNSFQGYYCLQSPSVASFKLTRHEDVNDYYPLPSYYLRGHECLSLKHSICSEF